MRCPRGAWERAEAGGGVGFTAWADRGGVVDGAGDRAGGGAGGDGGGGDRVGAEAGGVGGVRPLRFWVER